MRKVFVRTFFVFLITNLALLTAPLALPFKGNTLVMSAANRYAVQAAEKIAENGGNPVDVAVTLVLAMAVTNPTFAALGGGGFALIKMGKNVEVLDFRERAPLATSPDYYKDKPKDASITGGAASGVPGLPAGLWALHKKYGKIHWSQLFDAPIKLAQSGFRLSGEQSSDFVENHPRFNTAAKKYFLKNGLIPYKPGEILVQKNLSKALSEMRNRNIQPFYTGRIARDIVDTVRSNGGDMTLKDLENYKVVWRTPLQTTYAGHKIYLMPPPSSGGIAIKTALSLIEQLDLKKYAERSVDEFHMLGQILSRSFRGRTQVADPDHAIVNVEQLLSQKYLDELAKSISIKTATAIEPLSDDATEPQESTETTHLSVIDKFGNAVAMTFTLNGKLGSGVATENFGIMLNNEMDDFTTVLGEPNMFGLIQGQKNSVAPGKRPLSSMSPALVEKNGKIVLAVGAPGGPRIISSVVQIIYRILGRNMNIETAVEAPRVHHQILPNKLFVDENRFSPEILEGLRARKHIVEESWAARIFVVRNNNGILEAATDTRGEGATGGL